MGGEPSNKVLPLCNNADNINFFKRSLSHIFDLTSAPNADGNSIALLGVRRWKEAKMLQLENSTSNAQDVLQSIQKYKRLATLVREMAQEIERLDNDNAQLRAAVAIYREIARRCTSQPS